MHTGYVTKMSEYQYQYLLLDVKCNHGQLLYVPICTPSIILMSVEGVITLFQFWVSEMGICLCVQVQNQEYMWGHV